MGGRSVRARVLAVGLAVSSILAVFAAPSQADEPPARPNLVVGFHEWPGLEAGDAYAGMRVVKTEPDLRFAVLEPRDQESAGDLAQDPNVRYVDEDLLLSLTTFLTPNDPRYGSQYAPQQLRANLVWDTSLGTTALVVCVIDTGARASHEDLTAQYLGGADFLDGGSPDDPDGHGTHVSGIAAATVNNAKGIAGMGSLGLKAVRLVGAALPISTIAAGVKWCADNGTHVTNSSWGTCGQHFSAIEDAFNYNWAAGLVNFAAAGNNQCSNGFRGVDYPARYGNVVAVGCVDSAKNRCSFSGQGPQLDLAAPGLDIVATYRTSDTSYATLSGTSMASPAAAGAAALVWSIAPDMTNAELRSVLESTAQDRGPTGRDDDYGWGIVDSFNALNNILVPAPETPLLDETFDDGAAGGWTLSGLWHIDDACGTPSSAPNYLGYHRTTACDYNAGPLGTTGSASFNADLTGAIRGTLLYRERWQVESSTADVDVMTVEASGDAGSTWTLLRGRDATGPSDPAWRDSELSLDDFLGGPVRVRFTFDSVDGFDNAHPGWYLDDVRATASPTYMPRALAGPDVTVSDGDADGFGAVSVSGTGTDPDGTVVSYAWLEGSTVLASTAAASLDLAAGAHTLTFRVTDDEGAVASDTLVATVAPNAPPLANAGADQLRTDGESDGQHAFAVAATVSDADGSVVSVEWLEGATVLATTPAATLPLGLGAHTITLRVADNGGATATDTVTLTLEPNRPPTVNAGADQVRTDGDGDGFHAFAVAGTAADSDGTVALQEWLEGATVLATGASATLTLPSGAHTVTHRATDNGGGVGADQVVLRLDPNLPPTAAFAGTCVNFDCTFTAAASTDPEGLPLSHAWTFGDGALGAGATVAHTYAAAGAYAVTLTVTDAAGASDPDAKDFVVPVIDVVDENFDDGVANGFTLTGLWRVSSLCTPAPPSAPRYLGYHQASACNYNVASTTGSAVVAADLRGGPLASLFYRQRYALDTSSDVLRVEVSEDGGATYATLASHTGTDNTWKAREVVLDAYAGKVVLVRFRFTANCCSNTAAGWYLDDVRITQNIDRLPVAVAGPDVSVADADGTGSETIFLDGSASSDPGGGALSFEWLEGATVLATTRTALVPFAVGSHVVTLRVMDSAGQTATDTVLVTVRANVPPVAAAGADQSLSDGDGDGFVSFALDGSASVDADGSIVAAEWLEGGTLVATGLTPGVALAVGAHALALLVSDNGGATGQDTVLLTALADRPPVVNAGPDLSVTDGDGSGDHAVALSGSATDPDGTVVEYRWVKDGVVLATGASATVTLPVGDNVVVLEARGNGGAVGTDAVLARVLPNTPPVPAFVCSGCAPPAFTFNAGGSTDPDGTPASYAWSFGDGTFGTGAQVTHAYPAIGDYTVTLTVTDNGGATASLSKTLRYSATTVPFTPVAPVHVTDAQSDPGGDSSMVGNVQSAWFLADAANLYVALKVSLVTLDQRTEPGVAYRVNFKPIYPVADPTWGGAVPAGHALTTLRVQATFDPAAAGTVTRYQLQAVATPFAGGTPRVTTLGQVSGQASAALDTIWWPVPRSLLQAPGAGALLSVTNAASALTPAAGAEAPWDRTQTGLNFPFPSCGAFLA